MQPPEAKAVEVLDTTESGAQQSALLLKRDDEFFESIPLGSETTYDPHIYTPVLTQFNLHLLSKGFHQNLFDKLFA